MDIRDFFPEARINSQQQSAADWLTVALGGQFIHFPKSSLTEREMALISLKNEGLIEGTSSGDGWYQYLVQKEGKLPQRFEAVQFIYLEHQHHLDSALIDLLSSLLSNLHAVIPIHGSRTALLLCQTPYLEAASVLADIMPTLENDFGVSLTAFFGNCWKGLQQDELRAVFDSEDQLFSSFINRRNEKTVTFSEIILWGQSRQVDLGVIPEKILQAINESKDAPTIIQAMWESQGNLAQSAQRLFMHRNSLIYKLEKFRTASGLNLKNLNDLAFCHLLMLKA